MSKIFAASVLGLALIASPVLAQNSDTKAAPANKPAAQQNEQNASSMELWQASKLVGLNVYNSSDEKIGDIKEIMLDKQGKADIVVIAVGGFLGMGERDVAVKFAELKWSDEPARKPATTSSSNTRPGTTGTAMTANTPATTTKRNYPDHAVLNANKDQLKNMPQFNYNK
jgi:sporulation protein YlmC with PRC-barrel domain